MLIKDISYLELWWPLCSAKGNYFCNVLECIMRNNPVKIFLIWTKLVQAEMSFKRFLI